MHARVIKKVLANGLTILVKPSHIIPKVSTQLWYNVGSKDEKTGEKGIAHLIEHMIFKGTKRLSECDINMITHKLSGYTNAYTSYDYTGYLFDFPSQQWQEALPIMADCMRNCTFLDEHLNSELKAVIQELKMYRDDYTSSVVEALLSTMFADHPYHHPIIGYKQDLWSAKREALLKFYEYHYVPNNATLVIVGDVNPQEAFERAEKEFGHIKPNFEYKKENFYHGSDLRSQSVTLYRDIQVPLYILSWVVPGARKRKDYLITIATWILGSGKGSRLARRLVDELQIVTDLEAFNYDLFDYGVFFIYFQPKDMSNLAEIYEVIQAELYKLATEAVTEAELRRAIKQTEMEYLNLLESNQKQAYTLGKYYLATGDEHYLENFTSYPKEHLAQELQAFVATYLKPVVMYQGAVLPLEEQYKAHWEKVQALSDEEDERILAGRTRGLPVEEARCEALVEVYPPKSFHFAESKVFTLENGLRVLYVENSELPKIDLILDFEAKHIYDPEGKEGLGAFVAALLVEGTQNYTADQFAQTAESYGMTIVTAPGQIGISCLAVDLAKALELLYEMVAHALFDKNVVEKVRSQMFAEIREFWDTPSSFSTQLARQEIYKKHPYSKNGIGTLEGIKSITRDDITSFYKAYLSPHGSRLSIAGDVGRYDLKKIIESEIGSWRGPEVKKLEFPKIEPVVKKEITKQVLRDQTVLCYAGLSVSRMDPDYDKLLIFDQIFTGGLLGSMASRLFDLREQSGLFYTIGGSLIARVDEQPGLMVIKTIVSNDRRKEAEVAIEYVIDTAIDSITDDEFVKAKNAIINSLVDNFASNSAIALTMLFKDRFNLPADYYDKRAHELELITKDEVIKVVKKHLSSDRFILVKVGRIQ